MKKTYMIYMIMILYDDVDFCYIDVLIFSMATKNNEKQMGYWWDHVFHIPYPMFDFQICIVFFVTDESELVPRWRAEAVAAGARFIVSPGLNPEAPAIFSDVHFVEVS